MKRSELEALAYEEAVRLLEKEFSFHNPYSRVIETEGIPYGDIETFCRLVEDELELKKEKITRDNKYPNLFKIDKFQAQHN